MYCMHLLYLNPTHIPTWQNSCLKLYIIYYHLIQFPHLVDISKTTFIYPTLFRIIWQISSALHQWLLFLIKNLALSICPIQWIQYVVPFNTFSTLLLQFSKNLVLSQPYTPSSTITQNCMILNLASAWTLMNQAESHPSLYSFINTYR